MSVSKTRYIESILSCKAQILTDGSTSFIFNSPEVHLAKLMLKPTMIVESGNKIDLSIGITTSMPSLSSFSFILKLISRNNKQGKLFKTNFEINNQTPVTVKISNILPTLDKLLDPVNGYTSNNKIGFSIKLNKQTMKTPIKRNKSQQIPMTTSIPETNRTQTRKCGLLNYGCTCYMNSCLQIMYNIPFIRKELYKFDIHKTLYNEELLSKTSQSEDETTIDKNRETLERKGKWETKVNKIINALQIVFGKMEKFKASYYTPDELVKAFGWSSYNVLEQEDAHEFIRGILSKLEERQTELYHYDDCIRNKKDFLNTNFNVEHREGLIKFKSKLEMKYLTCGLSTCTLQNNELNFKNEKQEEFHDLTLDVTGYKDIYESLQAYLTPENLDGVNQYNTEEHGRIDVVKTTKIKRLPPLLMVQLKRFKFCMETGQMSKIGSNLAFYKELDMNNFVDDIEVDYSYKLFGFVVHKGHRLDSGHYYSIIDPQLNDKWYNFNDEDISRTNNNIEDYHGNDRTPICAYLLVYIRNDSIQELMCNNENVYSYLDPSISSLINKQKVKYEAKYIRLIENQNANQRNTLLMFEDNLFAKLLSGISESQYSNDLWIMSSYLIYGNEPFRSFITRGMGFDVPSTKWFIRGLNHIFNAQWCYKTAVEGNEEQVHEKDICPISNIENNLLNRNMISIHISSSNSFSNIAKELIYYIKLKVSLLKIKSSSYNPEINFGELAIFRINPNPREEYSCGLNLIYPLGISESFNSIFLPNRNGFYICELNSTLLDDKNCKKSIVLIKQEEKFVEGETCYLNKGAFAVESNLTLCDLKKLLVENKIIDNSKYYIKIETLRNKKYIRQKMDENTKLNELCYCVIVNFDLVEVAQHYNLFTVGVGVHEDQKDKITCELKSNSLVQNYYKFKIKKSTVVSELKNIVKDKMGIPFEFVLVAPRNANLDIYKQRKISKLSREDSQVKNLTCNEDFINHGVVNSSLCDSIEKAIETNDPTLLKSDVESNKGNAAETNMNKTNSDYDLYKMNCLNYKDEINENQNQNYICDDELEVWKVYEHSGMNKEYAASYRYYQEDFQDDTPDYYFELKEVCTLNDDDIISKL
eukprot:GAHX01000892.1.p1 GENE.GAHX01000892.1~~GAHX01000892.1.p1  ORF type:complete len:1098 (-),score=236.49 GAHX01000892.1:3138-6431(-)